MKITLKEYEEDPSLDDSAITEPQKEYILDDHTKKVTRRILRSESFLSFQPSRGFLNVSKELFLPIGFPHSVDSSYLPYQLYDGLQGLCSYWRGVVSTKAVLEASGVGNAQATAFSAAMNWALRDGTGMIGGLMFSYLASQYFDIYVKEFRLFADVINDVALTLDMIAPLFPNYSIHVLALSTICKTMCGMSAGATKGRITHHFSRQNGNMADLTAKESTQETLVSLLGMMGGVGVAHLLEAEDPFFTWFMFLLLTVLHVWANYKGVMLLKLSTLNPERSKVLLDGMLQVFINHNIGQDSMDTVLKEIASPEDISEPLLASAYSLFFPTILLSEPLDPTKLEFLEAFQDQSYILGCDKKQRLYIWLRVCATKSDQLQAFTHALLLRRCLEKGKSWNCDLIQRYVCDLFSPFDTLLILLQFSYFIFKTIINYTERLPRFECSSKETMATRRAIFLCDI
jgi:hypothetical protein